MRNFLKGMLITLSLIAATCSSALALPTEVFKRQYHVLILFFPQDESSELLSSQKLIMEHKHNFHEEKIIIMGVFQSRVELLHAPEGKKFGTSRSVANFIRHCFSVKIDTFRTILLNRFGEEKLRTTQISTFDQLKMALGKSPS